MTDVTIELRAAIHELTQPHDVKIEQHGRHLGTRTQQPLLTELDQARTARIGTGGGAHAAHERSPLNLAASDLYASISDRIRQWARQADIRQHWASPRTAVDWTDLPALLRAWHVTTLASHNDLEPYLETLQRWIRNIEDLLIDPPRRLPIEGACPFCGISFILLNEYERSTALVVLERDPMSLTETICRSCGKVLGFGLEGARGVAVLMSSGPGDAA